MTTRLIRDYLLEYARRPLNLVLLLAVPVLFVTVAADALTDFADALGAQGTATAVETVAAGWAAAFLAGVAGFFHVTGSHTADRRLAAAGAGSTTVVAARLASALVLAAVAGGGALVALWAATGIHDVPRAVGGTAMFAVTYLGLGTMVGALVRSEVNGSLLLIFVWLLDVFLGPAMAGSEVVATRLFPTHFPTQIMLDIASGHAGVLGDLGLGLVWTVGATVAAGLLLWRAVRPATAGRRRAHRGAWARLVAGLRFGLREHRRNVALWALLVVVPVVFISLSIAVTPDDPAPVELTENGMTSIRTLSMIDVHGATMVPITVGFLAGLAGMFVMLGSSDGDRRLVLAGFRTREVLAARFGVIGGAALLSSAVALGVTAVDFTPQAWAWFGTSTLLVALTYGMIGVLVGSLVGRLGGLYLMFLLPFLDIGLAQNVMFDAAPPAWGRFMPAHGAVSVLVDGAFTSTFDTAGSLLLAALWLGGITLAAAVVFHRLAAPRYA